MQFPRYQKEVPQISAKQMAEVDRLMVRKYQIELIQMMENAGRSLARASSTLFLKGQPILKKVAVLAGTGGNGGGAMAAARRLHDWGAQVQVFISKPAGRMEKISALQLSILKSLEISVQLPNALESTDDRFDVIIDGLIGYSLKGEPKGGAKKMIEWANANSAPIMALDGPSGVDLTEGKVHDPAIKADATLTLALPKSGLFAEEAIPYRGKLYLADIGVPPSLYAEPSLKIKVDPIFAEGDILLIAD